MALQLVFNPFTGKFDYINSSSSSGATAVPQVVANGVTYTIADNTQVCYANAIIAQAGGIVLTAGTGALTYVN